MSGTVDNLMARGEPSPEELAYDERPIACVSMLGTWLLMLERRCLCPVET